jgi:hypothetical protein
MTGCKGCLFLVDCLSKWGSDGEFQVGFAQCCQCGKYSVVREVQYQAIDKSLSLDLQRQQQYDLPEYVDLDYPQLDFLADGCQRLFAIENSFKCAECIAKNRQLHLPRL